MKTYIKKGGYNLQAGVINYRQPISGSKSLPARPVSKPANLPQQILRVSFCIQAFIPELYIYTLTGRKEDRQISRE